MNDIKITKQGLALRDLIPDSAVKTIEAIQREEGMTVTKSVATAYERGVMEPEKYPDCARVARWLRETTMAEGPEKTWLIIHERIKD